MTLSFEEKKAIFDSYPELEAVPVSLNRLNYHFKGSAVEHKIVVRHLHPNGNAFIYAGYLPKEDTQKGYLSAYDEDEATIREWVEQAISYLKKTEDGYEVGHSELWLNQRGETLYLNYDNPMWTITLDNGQVEAVFKSREQAEGYLMDEGFFEG